MTEKANAPEQFQPIEDPSLLSALNELGRSINIATTYGLEHPAFLSAIDTTVDAIDHLLRDAKKITLGAFNGVMMVDDVPIQATGALQKSLERRLTRLRVTGLRILAGITPSELIQLCDLLRLQDASDFKSRLSAGRGMAHIEATDTRFEALVNHQSVANTSDLAGMGGTGVLVLEDPAAAQAPTDAVADVQVDQIVAFLKGDIELDEQEIGEELEKLASDPAQLGKLIMESVSIRQSVSEITGESLGDIVLGCLRRTYHGLRSQPAFRTSHGVVDLRKALLMLEENVLDQMRSLCGEPDPELDRHIVRAIHEMDENLGFEMAAARYMEHKDAIEKEKAELQAFIHAKGTGAAEDLIADIPFPAAEWRRIVVESRRENIEAANPPLAAGLSTLTTVFERLELLMKSEGADGRTVKDLIGEASENLDDTIFTTKEKLNNLSQHLKEDGSGTIGGHGKHMSQADLLAALAEVAQELMQPLTAITATVDMLLQGFAGDVTTDQRDLLDLSANSGEHLKFLMKELINIVGCPTNKGVDRRFHTTSDKVVRLRDHADDEECPLSYFQ